MPNLRYYTASHPEEKITTQTLDADVESLSLIGSA
jgi:hypothetical protein